MHYYSGAVALHTDSSAVLNTNSGAVVHTNSGAVEIFPSLYVKTLKTNIKTNIKKIPLKRFY